MRFLSSVATLACLLSASGSALAEHPDHAAAATEAHCRWVRGEADSQAALLWSPQVFAGGGMVSAADVTNGNSGKVEPRVVAGLQVSVSSMVRAAQTQALADSECERYHVFDKVLAFTFAHAGGRSEPALKAKLAVLEGSLPRAEEMLRDARQAMADARINVEELHATTSRVDALHAEIARARGELRAVQGVMKAPDESLNDLVAKRDVVERNAEAKAAALRQSMAWDVQVRGGYDQVFGLHTPVPAFGMVTLTFSPGYFWQKAPDERAIQARADAARTGLEDATLRAQDTARELRETLRSEKDRLVDVGALLGELEQRHEKLAKTEGDRARAAADILWLWLVTLRAERAYLEAHVADLTKIVGPS